VIPAPPFLPSDHAVSARPLAEAPDGSGQIHDQVRNLPPGTQITGIKIS